MSRYEELKRLDKKTRNRLRHILSVGGGNAISSLGRLRAGLGEAQSNALEGVLSSGAPVRAFRRSTHFPKHPHFTDSLQPQRSLSLEQILSQIESNVLDYKSKLEQIALALHRIDEAFSEKKLKLCRELISSCITHHGWSHAILRKIVLVREFNDSEYEDDIIEELIQQAGLQTNSVVVSSLIHAYSEDQNYLTIKRSILNIADRGSINRYSRMIARLPVQPFARTQRELIAYLAEMQNCSLIDSVILAKFNSDLYDSDKYPETKKIARLLGSVELFEKIVGAYDAENPESEYSFFKQSSAWLEYRPIRDYRALLDEFYDASKESMDQVEPAIKNILKNWVGTATLKSLVGSQRFTEHPYKTLAKLECSGFTTRSAIFNYWLHESEGQIGFEKNDLLMLMGLTRDLARTIPIRASRTAARLAKDKLVRLILLLLLAKRSKNELDSFHLRKLIEEIAVANHEGSLVKLVESYQISHPYVADYIYEIATEDFLAKLNKLAPHRSDIPEIRASLHEWKARFTGEEYYLQRARAVRIDHQLNRVRNEIDDHRVYVDPSRFSSWIEDEMMIDLKSALTFTGSGKKITSINCDESVLTLVMSDCYTAFCSNAVFGIASYIGRRIRHGTFHGHLFSSVVNQFETDGRFQKLFRGGMSRQKWATWKERYSASIDEIIRDRLHVHSKVKPGGLLQPEIYNPHKLEILNAAVKQIVSYYAEAKSTEGIDQIVIDFCWRLAESDLMAVTRYLDSQRFHVKQTRLLDDAIASASQFDARLAADFKRDLILAIDRKLSSMLGWFKRPSIVAPKASLTLLFDAIVGEVRDSVPDFNPQGEDSDYGDIELVGGIYHIFYDSLAVIVSNAAKYGDPNAPVRRKFTIIDIPGPQKTKRLVVEIASAICQKDRPSDVAEIIRKRKEADFEDANLYQGSSGIPKLMQLASIRQDFEVEQLEVIGNEVNVRLSYALQH
jgi:hypothetical protein